ncbi:hypothetical protein BKA66DRAFT_554193 [Pyrenochaeta sp. MPI-SDFR-AT-0127]|nr:hypothetical protein BKA66DRAFT_554193 [Pyrenochaeta sp. MPI-SDFR-AT-0127]
MLYQDDITFCITSHNNQEMDLIEFVEAGNTASYKYFYPWLSIVTWTISGWITVVVLKDGTFVPNFCGFSSSIVHIDEDSNEEGETIALFMGLLHVQPEPVLSGALLPSSTDNAPPSLSTDAIETEDCCQVMFILAREIAQDSFRRIGLLSVKIDGVPSSVTNAIEEIMKVKDVHRDTTWKRQMLRLSKGLCFAHIRKSFGTEWLLNLVADDAKRAASPYR